MFNIHDLQYWAKALRQFCSPAFDCDSRVKSSADFLMVIMGSGIARGRVRMTATTTVESRNIAAILQIIG